MSRRSALSADDLHALFSLLSDLDTDMGRGVKFAGILESQNYLSEPTRFRINFDSCTETHYLVQEDN